MTRVNRSKICGSPILTCQPRRHTWTDWNRSVNSTLNSCSNNSWMQWMCTVNSAVNIVLFDTCMVHDVNVDSRQTLVDSSHNNTYIDLALVYPCLVPITWLTARRGLADQRCKNWTRNWCCPFESSAGTSDRTKSWAPVWHVSNSDAEWKYATYLQEHAKEEPQLERVQRDTDDDLSKRLIIAIIYELSNSILRGRQQTRKRWGQQRGTCWCQRACKGSTSDATASDARASSSCANNHRESWSS